MSSTPIA